MTASKNDTRAGDPCREPVLVDLALQGGGAHGAYTWGVLDRLLEEPWLKFDGISGTSAGAMNAAVMAYGLEEGGVAGARDALAGFWRRVADAALLSPFRRGPLEILTGQWTLDYSLAFVAADIAARLFSPYTVNVGGGNPLQKVLEESIDFGKLAKARTKLTDYWSEHGIEKGREYAILTNLIHQEWAGLSVAEHKEAKGLTSHNLRDHMTEAELIFTALAELSTRQIAENLDATGLRENTTAAKAGGGIARQARRQLESQTGKSVVSGENYLPPRAEKGALKAPKKKPG